MSKSYKLLISLIIGLFALSCTGRHHDKRLTAVAEIVSDSPKEAMQRLDSINAEQLTAADRHFYDFLTIKARDKAYVYHTSDSLILDVVSYYSSHDKALYPEVLYYAGRVYSDLGDYPTALRYFQEGLDQLPADTKDLDLKCRLLSQTGRLLNTLRLYKEAIPYVESTIEINKLLNDTVNTIYNLQLLGSVYLRAKIYNKAEKYLTEALDLGTNFSREHEIMSQMYLAQVKYKTNQLDSALSLIRGLPEEADSILLNSVLGYATNIYLDKDILDTAYIYANTLIHSTDHGHKEVGYNVILSPKLRGFIPKDSLDQYYSSYTRLLNSYYNHNQSQLAITQTALYNYEKHERERLAAEKSKEAFKNWLIGIMVISLFLLCLIFYQKNRSNIRIIRLQEMLENIIKLKTEVEQENQTLKEARKESASSQPSIVLSTLPPTEERVREKIRNELIALSKDDKKKDSLSTTIIESEPYNNLQQLINQDSLLKDNDPLWQDMERKVLEVFPNFLKNLHILTRGKLKDIELQTALLIKFGIRPNQMTILLGKSNGAIISRRESLGKKIFDKKVSVMEVDIIIRLM